VSAVTYKQAPDALFRAFGDEVLLARPEREELDRLSGAASAIWRLLDRPREEEEILTILAERYGTTPAAIASDVRRVLTELSARAWLRRMDHVGD
jgi:hypothetical protein